MKCKNCGKEFIGIISDICPFCGTDNSISLLDALFSNNSEEKKKQTVRKPFDPYD